MSSETPLARGVTRFLSMTGTNLAFQIVFGSLAAAGGAAAACWFCRMRIRDMKRWKDEIARAQAILAQAEGVTTSVADDVGQHATRVSAINAELASLKTTGSARITAAVTELIHVNQKMQQRLAEAEEKLQEQSHALATQVIEARTDALTGLPNRRAFDDELARRLAEFQRHGTAFSAMLLDIDHFKQFNDRYGHATGDEVLRGIARELQRTIRGLDMVARYGGEEFVVVLPRATVEEARQAGERYRLAVDTARFHCSGEDLAVTTSVGVAQILANENPVEMLRRADRALYASKRAGRNRLHWHDGRDVHPFPAADLPEPSIQTGDVATSVCDAPTETRNNGPVSQPASATDVDPPVPALVTNEPDDPSESEGEDKSFTDQHDRMSFVRNVRHRVGEWKRTGATFTVMLVRVDEYARIAADDGQSMADTVVLATLKFLS
ncbi:MAG: GGDEF domain-containing protein, partial [Planctomycetes bacterium]|nr:GGDEF domain-containing protein [Planctomycetota bacterium]